MDDDLTQRLTLAENDFLCALQNGPQLLCSFRQTLSTLPNALSTATKTGDADNAISSLAYSVASRILNIASCYLCVKDEEESSSAKLRLDCDALLRQIHVLSLDSQPESLHSDGGSQFPTLCTTSISDTSTTSPSLIPAYQWLLSNLHNPYPSREVKTRIAATSSCRVSSVNSWFINVRRRIGWTALCRERFSNCRADMVDAAYRALVEEDPQRVLPPELRHSFVTMKATAEDLYSSVPTRVALAGNSNVIVKITDKHKESVKAGKCCQVQQEKLGKTVHCPCPSPNRPAVASPVPALDEPSMDESEKAAPPVIAGSKRRRSFMELSNPLSCVATRPIKRLRSSIAPLTFLPSPPSSTDAIELSSLDNLPRLSSIHSTYSEANKVLPLRTQCVSDIHATEMPEHPSGLATTSRFHTILDPLLHSNTGNEFPIDNRFSTNLDSLFAIPPPVEAIEPDFSALWEVELFRDYNIPGNLNLLPSTAEITQVSEFDSILQSITSDTFVTPLGDPYTSPDLAIPDMSHIDWTSLLSSSDTYQSKIATLFQYPTESQSFPEIGLSVPKLAPITPFSRHQSNLTSKQAKLDQLHAMQEAVRRMEQELQSEGATI